MLRKKMLTAVTISNVLVFIFMFVYLKKSIDRDYKNLEILRSESIYHLIDHEFQGMYKDLEKINIDWSKWDDTYGFIEGDDKVGEIFIKSNLDYGVLYGILSDLNLNFIIFQDDHGQTLYQQSYDDLSEKKISRGKIEMIAKKISDYTEKTGVLVGEGKEAIVFSNLKISDSKNVKKSNGNLIMGYFLNKNRVMAIEEKLGIQLSMAGTSQKLKIPYKINIGKDRIYNKLYISTLSGGSVILIIKGMLIY
ncbi:CHASE4 domain-containing protein [Psychrilyobacter sp.]|uniref:CHASE4 domain-containing protein n=1 Tax=Psychrilyobacter sp. TaxID=2586924 RepID=UPI003017732D